MPKYYPYATLDKKPEVNKIEKFDTPSNVTVNLQCPPGSAYDTVNPRISTSKPCHCLNPDGTYSKKWIHIDGAC